jgi:thiamine pyrophosphate-dependent acetolactate synthase large subunit-like protein
MSSGNGFITVADALVRRLRDHRVRFVFGYPGGQITPIYDALYRQLPIRHILARHEQAAAFMADGYARATGSPGVCLAVCGPGVYNAATPLATAFTDSVPVLLLTGQVPTSGIGLRSGYYHENDQQSACSTFTKWCGRVDDAEVLISIIDVALITLCTGRPGPGLLEIPVDVLRQPYPHPVDRTVPMVPASTKPTPADIDELARLLAGWKRPVLIAGGGVVEAAAGPLLVQLAERLGAPVFHTFQGKCAIPGDHPLAARLPWSRATSDLSNMQSFMSPLFAEADGVLAIGCRFSQTFTASWSLKLPRSLAHIDIDREEIGRHYPVALGIHADARLALRELLAILPDTPRVPWANIKPPGEPSKVLGMDLMTPLRRVLPRDAIIAGDVTQLSYSMLAEFPMYEPRTFFHPAGFVAMGYGIPAALGAKAAFPDRTVVTVVGDGCFLMCGMELATAVQERLPIIVVLINDGSLTLIKSIQERRYEGRYIGVDLMNPDFQMIARAFGVRSWRVTSETLFETALREALASGETGLIEVRA